MNPNYKLSGIYAITNLMNGKKYIGHSINIKKRWKQHRTSLNRNVSKHAHLQSAWNIYGKSQFAFSIIEPVPLDLTKQQYEEIETKWVLHFKTHLSEFGYNSVLPGSFPLREEGENITSKSRQLREYVCINSLSGEVLYLTGRQNVTDAISISPNKVEDLSAYWKGKNRKKSLHGWMIIKKDEYDPDFDYINYKKERKAIGYKYGHKATWKDTYNKERYRKSPEDIIPHKDRNLKRCSIVAHNILTGEERIFPMMKSCAPEFNLMKVRKCVSSPFGKYKHRGYWFRKAN